MREGKPLPYGNRLNVVLPSPAGGRGTADAESAVDEV